MGLYNDDIYSPTSEIDEILKPLYSKNEPIETRINKLKIAEQILNGNLDKINELKCELQGEELLEFLRDNESVINCALEIYSFFNL